FGGGRIPFGYKKVPCVIDGIHTSKYEAVPEQAEIIKLAYDIYSKPNATLGDVLEAIHEKGNTDIKWSLSHISRLLKNPAYTNATIDIYQFFKAQGAEIVNAPEEYDGTKSMMLYEGDSEDWRSSTDKGRYLVLVPHKGIVDPDVWLTCRRKFAKNRQVKITTAKNSWLAGKIKCGHCGYGLTVRSNEYKTRYVNCTGRAQYRVCKANLPVIKADELEQTISNEIKNKLEEIHIHGKSETENAKAKRIDELTAEIEGIDEKIKKLIALTLESSETTVKYLNESISELDEKKKSKQLEIEQLRSELRKDNSKNIAEITSAVSHWDDLSFDDKRGVVNLLINKISVYENKIEIDWAV
ncbi:MAG: recombinase family protein, partial [Clostridia bacterium]|nr:recombinase family protein [Clostridia bacterium]